MENLLRKMKTTAPLLPVLLFLIPFRLFAQPEQKPVSLTLDLEPHVNWLHPDESHLEPGPLRIGAGAGLRLDFAFRQHFAFSTGVGVNQTGGSLVFNEQVVLDRTTGFDTLMAGSRVTYRLQYVEIPLALKVLTRQIGYNRYFLEAGLDPMFNTRALIDATDNNILKEAFQQGIALFDLGYRLGIGLNRSLGRISGLHVAVYYRNTFLDITRENDIRKPDNTRLNQVGLSLGLTL